MYLFSSLVPATRLESNQ